MLSLESYSNRWLWFNDSDVRRFDPEHLANASEERLYGRCSFIT